MKKLEVTRAGETEKGKTLSIGMQVNYRGHIPGGLVKIEMDDGTVDVAHPACFGELE